MPKLAFCLCFFGFAALAGLSCSTLSTVTSEPGRLIVEHAAEEGVTYTTRFI